MACSGARPERLPAGSIRYSEAMKNSNVVWTRETLDAYLAKPKEFMPDSTMNFPGLRKPEDREAVITYLEQATK